MQIPEKCVVDMQNKNASAAAIASLALCRLFSFQIQAIQSDSMAALAARLALVALLAAAVFDAVSAQAGTTAQPFVWGRPANLVGTPFASEITPLGNGKYGFKPVSTSTSPFFITYHKTPHNLYLSRSQDGKELGQVAPAEFVAGKKYDVEFPGKGTYYINDVYKNYDATQNAYLKVSYT